MPKLTAGGRQLVAEIWRAYRSAIQRRLGDKLAPGTAEVLAATLVRLLD